MSYNLFPFKIYGTFTGSLVWDSLKTYGDPKWLGLRSKIPRLPPLIFVKIYKISNEKVITMRKNSIKYIVSLLNEKMYTYFK